MRLPVSSQQLIHLIGGTMQQRRINMQRPRHNTPSANNYGHSNTRRWLVATVVSLEAQLRLVM